MLVGELALVAIVQIDVTVASLGLAMQRIEPALEDADGFAVDEGADFGIGCEGGPGEVGTADVGALAVRCDQLQVGKWSVALDRDCSESAARLRCRGRRCSSLFDGVVAVAAAGVADRRLYAASRGCSERDGEDVEAACVEEGAEDAQASLGADDESDHRFGGHTVDAVVVDFAAGNDGLPARCRCGRLDRPSVQARASWQTRSTAVGIVWEGVGGSRAASSVSTPAAASAVAIRLARDRGRTSASAR